jgi:uncharacterized protein YwgA
MTEKTISERVENNLLFLYLVSEASKAGRVEDDLKAQKLVFLSQKKLVQKKLKAFSYTFLRWHKGPFSKDLAEDIKSLVKAGMLTRIDDKIALTDAGKEIVARSEELLTKQPEFMVPIKAIAQLYGAIPSEDLKEKVYDISVWVPRLKKVMKIRDIEEKQLILYGLSAKKARKAFNLDENWQATLEIVFDKDALDSLKMAQQDAVEGRICDFDTL